MNESEIASSLKSKLADTAIKEQSERLRAVANETERPDPDTAVEVGLTKMRLMEYFDIPREQQGDVELNRMLDKIMSFTDAKSFGDMTKILSNFERKLGTRLHPRRVYRLYQHMKIQNQITELNKRRDALYG